MTPYGMLERLHARRDRLTDAERDLLDRLADPQATIALADVDRIESLYMRHCSSDSE